MPTTLPIAAHNRRFAIGHEFGEVFHPKEDYDGLTLTIELKSDAEAEAVRAALIEQRKPFTQ